MAGNQHKAIVMADGAVFTLPGSRVFDMPHAIPSEIDIFTIDSIQRYPISSKLELEDNIFRYAEFGGTTKAGDLIASEAPDAAHDALTAGTDGSVLGVAASFAAGSKVINISDTITLVLNEYAGGRLYLEVNTGRGYSYHIESHDAPASDALFVIKHGLAVPIDATTELVLIKNKFKEILIQPTSIAAPCVGVSAGVGADGSFGWVTTRGPASVLTSGTVIIGEHVRAIGATTAGACIALNRDGSAEDEQSVGYVMDVGVTTGQSLIFMQVE